MTASVILAIALLCNPGGDSKIKIMDGKVFLRGAPVCQVNDKGLKKYKYVGETNIRLEYKNGQVFDSGFARSNRAVLTKKKLSGGT